MSIQSSAIVQRVWNYCNVLRELAPMLLRDDGISYGDCVEQLTYSSTSAPTTPPAKSTKPSVT